MSGTHWRGWIAQIGMRRPGTLVWARAQLGDPHLTRDEWAEFIEYQAAHLTPAQVDAFAPWVHHREPGCACGECVPALSFTEQEADRNARGVKPGEHLIAAADAADVGRAELDGLNQDQFTAVHALLRRLEREQPGIVTDAELSAICGLPPWWKPLRQREPGWFAKADRKARASEGLMATIEATFVAMQDSVNRTVERIDMARRTGAVTPRPCCHTTGPHHHPACTTNRTEQQ